jgi:polysaccharide biosynthesis/export protein
VFLRYGKNVCVSVVVVLLPLLLVSCIGLMPSPFRPSPGPQKSVFLNDLAEAFEIVCRNYRIGPADVLSINYHTQWNLPRGSYKLDALDEIKVEFILDPELNRELVIRPDGMITLPGVGELYAVGLGPSELAEKIEAKYRRAKIFKEGESDLLRQHYRLVTVTVVKFYQKIEKLVESLRSLSLGQTAEITVKPDGTIDLPILRDRVLAAGHTVQDVEWTVNKIYRTTQLRHVVISLALRSANSRKVYVMGEVNNPGAYEISQPITALHAVALAGGHRRDSADLTSVILISKNVHGKPIGRRLDLKRILDVGDMGSAILVKPYDVLYVPKTYVADLRIFMDQYFATASEVAGFINTVTTGN